MKAAVLGSPISHSLSPVLHRAAYKQLGLDHTYEAIEVNELQLPGFVRNCDSAWLGLSLTMPLKEIAFEVADKSSAIAHMTGSINTLIFAEQIKADNTDVYGLATALRFGNCSNPKSATILGSGATARSAIAALSGLGTQEIVVIARNKVSAARCVDLGNELGIILDTSSEPASSLFNSDVVINTTPKGVADDFISFTSAAHGTLLDVVYDPWPSKLVSAWRDRKLNVVPGYEMLLHQAVRQVELMTGLIPDSEHMKSALHQALKERGLDIR